MNDIRRREILKSLEIAAQGGRAAPRGGTLVPWIHVYRTDVVDLLEEVHQLRKLLDQVYVSEGRLTDEINRMKGDQVFREPSPSPTLDLTESDNGE